MAASPDPPGCASVRNGWSLPRSPWARRGQMHPPEIQCPYPFQDFCVAVIVGEVHSPLTIFWV